MINQTQTEYDSIKVLREIQLIRKLNNLSNALAIKAGSKENGKGIFVPELIDIITTGYDQRLTNKRPSSYGGANSGQTKASSNYGDNFQNIDPNMNDSNSVDLTEICLVMEFLESDLDQLLKC